MDLISGLGAAHASKESQQISMEAWTKVSVLTFWIQKTKWLLFYIFHSNPGAHSVCLFICLFVCLFLTASLHHPPPPPPSLAALGSKWILVPNQESNPGPPQWKLQVWTTGGNSRNHRSVSLVDSLQEIDTSTIVFGQQNYEYLQLT